MRCFIALLFILSVVYSAHGLSAGEIKALEALYSNLPQLGRQQPPWTANATAACDHPVWYGLECSKDPDQHVIRMYVVFKFFSF